MDNELKILRIWAHPRDGQVVISYRHGDGPTNELSIGEEISNLQGRISAIIEMKKYFGGDFEVQPEPLIRDIISISSNMFDEVLSYLEEDYLNYLESEGESCTQELSGLRQLQRDFNVGTLDTNDPRVSKLLPSGDDLF